MADEKKIKIACTGAGVLGLPFLTPLQGDLKELLKEDYERLRAEILKDGFSYPVAVWEDQEDGHCYILDGHQRVETLKRLQKEGYAVPEIPIVMVEAEDMDQAKHKLLAAASQYGTVTEGGLQKFLQSAAVNAEEFVANFKFSGIDMNAFAARHFELSDELDIGSFQLTPASNGTTQGASSELGSQSGNIASAQQVRMVQLFFDGETHPEFLQKIQKIQQERNYENMTDAVLEVVREAFDSLGA